MFEFDTTETIFTSPELDIILSTSLLATIPSEGSPNTITITNGKPGAYITGLLGDTQTSLTASQIDSYQNLLNSLSLSVRKGYLEIYVNPTAQSLNIQVKIYTPDIPVGDSATTGLTTTITFKIKQKHFTLPDTEEVYSPNWDTIVNNMVVAGTGILIVAGIGALVLTVGPEMGAAAVLFRTFLALFK